MKRSSKIKAVSIAAIMCGLLFSSSVVKATTYNFKEHITSLHTKEEIETKYNESVNPNYPEVEYEVEPVAQYPYVVGSLKQTVRSSVINRINYYRWLSGLNDVTENSAKNERNQKGAILLNRLGTLTHTPEKPDDMDEDFFNEGYSACFYGIEPGDVYSGNVAYDNFHSLPDIVDLYIADIYNGDTSHGAVGHRLSILDPFATKVSMGKCGYYSTLSVYYEPDSATYNSVSPVKLDTQPYYSYPTAGYFPKQFCFTNEYWSILIPGTYSLKKSNIKVTIEYDGKIYAVPTIQEASFYAIDFKLPDALVNQIGGEYSTMPEGQFIIRANGFKVPGNTYLNIEYTVNFFDADIPITEIFFEKEEYTVEVGETEKIGLFYSPAAADVEPAEINWSVEDGRVASIDENGIVTALRPGVTNITVTVQDITRTCKLIVPGDPYIIGDLDNNGKVNAEDAAIAIEIFKKSEYDPAADIDGNGRVTAEDAALILEIFKTSK